MSSEFLYIGKQFEKAFSVDIWTEFAFTHFE